MTAAEIDFRDRGAQEAAIEFRSFSKTAGFTGMRCAYTVVPKSCKAYTAKAGAFPSCPLEPAAFDKIQRVAYPVQRAAEAIYSDEGKPAKILTDYYLKNAVLIRQEMGPWGSTARRRNSPYIWIDAKADSGVFRPLLKKPVWSARRGPDSASAVKVFIRISAFNNYEKNQPATEKIKTSAGLKFFIKLRIVNWLIVPIVKSFVFGQLFYCLKNKISR